VYTDLLLGVLKKFAFFATFHPSADRHLRLTIKLSPLRIRKKRKDLRIIISSATIDAYAPPPRGGTFAQRPG
jgi:hypothetical protein